MDLKAQAENDILESLVAATYSVNFAFHGPDFLQVTILQSKSELEPSVLMAGLWSLHPMRNALSPLSEREIE